MKIVVLTGPAGAGKNTIGYELAKRRKKCAVIDVDLVRWMLFQPHKGPWEDAEGEEQQNLGVLNTCLVAENFVKNNYDVVILDVITNATAKLYREKLKNYSPRIILLLPTFEEAQQRIATREFRITQDQEKLVYSWQKELRDFDEKIDNTNLSADNVVEKILTQLG